MATFTKSDGSWTGSTELSKQSSSITIPTSKKYVDADIVLTANVKSGSVNTPATTITANPSLSTTKETNGYKMSVSKTQSVTPNVGTAGWISNGTAGTITVSGSAYIPAATGSASVNVTSNNVNGNNVVFGDTNLSNVTVGGSVSGTVTASTTAGYTPANNSYATANISSTATTKNVKGIVLNTGYQFDITNDITETVTVKYTTADNCLNFIFS